MSEGWILIGWGGWEIWEDYGFGIWVGYYGISRLLTDNRGKMLLLEDYSLWANQTHPPGIQQRAFVCIYRLTTFVGFQPMLSNSVSDTSTFPTAKVNEA